MESMWSLWMRLVQSLYQPQFLYQPQSQSWAGQNEPAVPSAAVRLGRLGSSGSAWRRCRPADSAGRTAGRHFGRPSWPAGPPGCSDAPPHQASLG